MINEVDITSINVNSETITKIKKVIDLLLSNPKLTYTEISKLTGYSEDSIQKYFTRYPEVIEKIYDKKVVEKINNFNFKKRASANVGIKNSTEIKIRKTIDAFLENPDFSDEKLAQVTGFSSSSIQRYLTHPIVPELCDEKVQSYLFELLVSRQLDGRRKGGMKSFANNIPIKDDNGRFTGSKKYTGVQSRIEQKYIQIKQMVTIFLLNESFVLEDIAKMFGVTRDYVYDCFTVSYLATIIKVEDIFLLRKRLEDNQQLGRVRGAETVNSKMK